MMSTVFKWMSMRKSLVVLVFATLVPLWAQAQGQSGAKAHPSQPSAQAKARAAADLTARLQALAIAEAQAQTAAWAKASMPPSSPLPVGAAPADGVSPVVSPVISPLSPANAGLLVAPPRGQSATDPVSQDLVIAQQIHQGLMPCEMGLSVRVVADAAAPGYFHVQGKGFRYRMYPVHTNTGALRLEDKKAGAVWLQLANKSMLMDQKKGRRVADECAHPEQVAYGQDMKTKPPPSLFDKTGMGRSND